MLIVFLYRLSSGKRLFSDYKMGPTRQADTEPQLHRTYVGSVKRLYCVPLSSVSSFFRRVLLSGYFAL